MRLPGVMGGSCTQGRDQAKGDGAVEINNMESKSCGWREKRWGGARREREKVVKRRMG